MEVPEEQENWEKERELIEEIMAKTLPKLHMNQIISK